MPEGAWAGLRSEEVGLLPSGRLRPVARVDLVVGLVGRGGRVDHHLVLVA